MPAGRGQDGRGDGTVVDLGAEPARAGQAIRARVGSEHLVAAQDQHLHPEAPDRAAPTTSTRPGGTSSAARSTHASGSTQMPSWSRTESGSGTQWLARSCSAKPPGAIRSSRNSPQVDW